MPGSLPSTEQPDGVRTVSRLLPATPKPSHRSDHSALVQLIDGQPVYSATDLVGFLACEHLTALERAALAGLVKRPIATTPSST